jgi:hypothetical protein
LQVDVILDNEGEGWVRVCANEAGRGILYRIFPDLPIDWNATPDIAKGYAGASLHIERMTSKSDVTQELPEITGVVGPIQNRFAYRLGALLTAEGARVAITHEEDGQTGLRLIEVFPEQ